VGYGDKVLPRALLVDDLDDVRTMVRIALRLSRTAEVVAEAATSRQAAEVAAQVRPDLVVLDVRLPDASGRETFTRVRDVSPTSKVVMFTVSDSDRDWYVQQGALYVHKSAGTPALVEALRGSPA
jgi:DNA-binding NarL/FixJ family response regulator